jgi:hypothetical protein
VAWAAGLAVPGGIAIAAPSAWGPAPGHTGGFGDPTCRECHSDNPLNVPGGTLELDAPEQYKRGETYRLTVRLRRPGMRRGGFQMVARYAAGQTRGKQAGQFSQPEDRRIALVEHPIRHLTFVEHTPEGTVVSDDSELQWSIQWQAPVESSIPVVFNVAGNASNDDDSNLGDFIYTVSREVRGAQ